MGEETPRGPRPRPIPADLCPVVMSCRACGRHPNEWLTWAEAQRLFGFARTSCLTCLLTDVHRPRKPPDDVPESATIL
jgi:hypothetical protein